MANLTLAIPEDLRAKMAKFPEINWSEVARRAIFEKMEVLEWMNYLLADSKLTEYDAIRIGRQIKKRVWRKHRRTA